LTLFLICTVSNTYEEPLTTARGKIEYAEPIFYHQICYWLHRKHGRRSLAGHLPRNIALFAGLLALTMAERPSVYWIVQQP
jgi:hypothetical protein